MDKEAYEQTKAEFFREANVVVRNLAPAFVSSGIKKQLQAAGLGRHHPDEITELGKKDLAAISEYLGDKQFFLGDTPSTIDATLYAFLQGILVPPIDNGIKKYIIDSLDNLVQYHKRMQERYWPTDADKKDESSATEDKASSSKSSADSTTQGAEEAEESEDVDGSKNADHQKCEKANNEALNQEANKQGKATSD